MNAWIAAAAALLLAAAAVQADSLADPAGMDPSCKGHEQNRETYLRELEHVVNAGRMELVDELIATDYVNHSAPPGAPQGRAAIRGYLAIMRKAFPDRAVKNEMLLCAGDYIIVRSTVTGTSLGPYFGRPPTGKRFSVMGTDIYLVRDGQLCGRWGNEDALGMMVQLGYVDAEAAMRPPATSPAAPGETETNQISPIPK
jgi:predicted ester cyclase